MTCFECDTAFGGDLWHCHNASAEHHDGTTECLSGDPCELPHELHDFRLSCTEFDPPCGCGTVVEAPVIPTSIETRHPVAVPARAAA